MKKPLFTILFLAFIALSLSQNTDYIRAIYQLTYKPSKTYKDITRKEQMLLLIDQRHSRFISVGQYVQDSVFNSLENRRGFIPNMQEIPHTSFKEIVSKDHLLGKISVAEDFSYEEYFKYKEDLHPFQWTIDPEKKVIKGYNCQKATTHFAGRDYTAWFTAELPISDGPYKFNGLPGLIIEIYDTDDHYHYALTFIKQIKTPHATYEKEKDYFTVSKKKFIQLKKEYEENPFRSMELRYGHRIRVDKERKKQKEERAKYSDNPIELIDF